MPRGRKSKLRAREKCRRNRAETQGLERAQAAAGEEEEAACSSSSLLGEGPSSSVGAGTLQAPLSAPATTSAAADISWESSAESSVEDLRMKETQLVEYVLHQYNMQKRVKKKDMLNIIQKQYQKNFPEILRRVSDRLDMFFGVELKKKPTGRSYIVMNSQDTTSDARLRKFWKYPIKGILMSILGGIFLNGNHASEEEIWEFLNNLGFYEGKSHFNLEESKKLIFQELLQAKYLMYQRVPDCDPPRYEFLWGPRAHAETSKMRVLQFVAKLRNTEPAAIQPQYEEALKEEEQRGQARTRAAPTAALPSTACGPSRATSSSFPHSQ